jgi:3-phenylpropionate/trans-cinnamate dioxygenase ferredoxin reductase subunit
MPLLPVVTYKVLSNVQETPDTWTITVAPADGSAVPAFKPGQFFMFHELDANSQPIKGKNKPYSLASSPTDLSKMAVCYKITGYFTHLMMGLAPGAGIGVQGPYGVFTLREEAADITMIAGGVGITPFMSMIRYAAEKRLPNRMRLLFSNKTQADIVYREELARLEKANPNFSVVHTLTRENGSEWQGERGRISQDFLAKHSPPGEGKFYYICGADAMVKDCFQHLRAMGAQPGQVKVENFGEL